jgi:hypothetical protein
MQLNIDRATKVANIEASMKLPGIKNLWRKLGYLYINYFKIILNMWIYFHASIHNPEHQVNSCLVSVVQLMFIVAVCFIDIFLLFCKSIVCTLMSVTRFL